MYILAFILLIIGLSKLFLAFSTHKVEMKELLYQSPVVSNVPPGILVALVTFDGLVETLLGLFILVI